VLKEILAKEEEHAEDIADLRDEDRNTSLLRPYGGSRLATRGGADPALRWLRRRLHSGRDGDHIVNKTQLFDRGR